METYGTDKPDLRIDLTVQDATACMADCGFGPFEGAVVKAVKADGFKGTRKAIDKMMADIEVQSGNKAYWFKVDENGALTGGIAKFLQERADAVKEALGLKTWRFRRRMRRQKAGCPEDSRSAPQIPRRCCRRPYEDGLL